MSVAQGLLQCDQKLSVNAACRSSIRVGYKGQRNKLELIM
jgi:hypothetical protein